MRIAIMQPYFVPYAGYFRLFHETDLFVIYDCVQFIRRGWIHRNQFSNPNGEFSWLTLPLVKMPQESLITELAFTDDAAQRMQEQQQKFPVFKSEAFLASEFNSAITQFSSHPVAYITELLKLSCENLNIPFNVINSSTLNLPSSLKGQDRIITIAKHFGAKTYINAPGGISLYNEQEFKHHNIKLQFLPEYSRSNESILPRLIYEGRNTLRKEITNE